MKKAQKKTVEKPEKPVKQRKRAPRPGEGRPRVSVKERLEKITFDNKKIFELAKRGFTDESIAAVLGISLRSIQRWKFEAETTPEGQEFLAYLKKGKELSDSFVEASLFHRATGYDHDDIFIAQYCGKIVTKKIKKHYPPDTTAAIFWLKNRRSKDWKDKHEVEHDLKGVGVLVVPAGTKPEDWEKLAMQQQGNNVSGSTT